MALEPEIVVQHPPRERWGEAMNLVLSHRPYEERIRLTDMLLRPVPGKPAGCGFDGLLEARAAGAMVGAALAVIQAGRTALVYQPRLAPSAPVEARPRLLERQTAFLRSHRVTLAQEVLAFDAFADIERAREAGYTLEIDLVYLLAQPKALLDSPAGALTWDAFTLGQERRLASVLDRTFSGTRDCPELNGVRSTLDSIVGYRASGQFNPQLWQFAVRADQDVGCVLVNRHDATMAELVYLGLVPEARGNRWSHELVQRALRLASEAGCGALSVAVDARNLPAISAYERAGFERFDARRVLLRVFGDSAAS